jgi:hypothetical protein
MKRLHNLVGACFGAAGGNLIGRSGTADGYGKQGGGGGGGSSYAEKSATNVKMVQGGGSAGNGVIVVSW